MARGGRRAARGGQRAARGGRRVARSAGAQESRVRAGLAPVSSEIRGSLWVPRQFVDVPRAVVKLAPELP